ncbi:hypothetical protein MTO96_011103 [Rhipicephalus appendiculatus]
MESRISSRTVLKTWLCSEGDRAAEQTNAPKSSQGSSVRSRRSVSSLACARQSSVLQTYERPSARRREVNRKTMRPRRAMNPMLTAATA